MDPESDSDQVMSAEYGLCLTCYQIIDPSVYRRGEGKYDRCPIMGCENRIAWIDENLLPIIITLNKKGYRTQNCCAGHIWAKYPFINIDFGYGVILPETPPKGFDFFTLVAPDPTEKKIANYASMRSLYDKEVRDIYKLHDMDKEGDIQRELSLSDRQDYLFRMTKQLSEWAESIPTLRELYESRYSQHTY